MVHDFIYSFIHFTSVWVPSKFTVLDFEGTKRNKVHLYLQEADKIHKLTPVAVE
jgi:hypothetical protein